MWLGKVDSEVNPTDGLSSLGVAGPWTVLESDLSRPKRQTGMHWSWLSYASWPQKENIGLHWEYGAGLAASLLRVV